MITRNTGQNEQEYNNNREEAHEIFIKKKYCLNQTRKKKLKFAKTNNKTKKYYQRVNDIKK
jgi:hypothetical protein